MRNTSRGLAGLRGAGLALMAAVALGACATAPGASAPYSVPASVLGAIPAAPVVVADQTKLDEQVGLTLTLAYTAAARLASLSIRTGIVSDPATLAAIGRANVRAKGAVDAVRLAYLAGNSTSYLLAIKNARAAIAGLLNSVKG